MSFKQAATPARETEGFASRRVRLGVLGLGWLGADS